jgi:uncharacterized protein YbcI
LPTSDEPELWGTKLEVRIADEIARLQAEYYGVAPKVARAYNIPGKVVLVVLRETFTPAEKMLIGHGDAEAIQHSRRRFQQISRDQFVSVVEQATGEKVESFLSETSLETEVAVEIFLMAGEARTKMEDFERSQQSVVGDTTPTPNSARFIPRKVLGTDKGRRPDGQAGRDT